MPTTTFNIDRIRERVPDKSRETILDVLDEIQLIVYSQNCLQTQKIDTTGMPPYLATTLDQYEYECPSDCRSTAAIFCVRTPAIRANTGRLIQPYGTYKYNNKEYFLVPLRSRDATQDTAAKVWLRNNPGTTTETYYHLYYMKATTLSSEEVQLTIPEHVHWRLRIGVITMFTSQDYGKGPYDDNAIERIARKIRNSLNQGVQSDVGTTEVQEEYRDETLRNYGFRSQ